MEVEPESQRFLRQRLSAHVDAIQAALKPLLEHPPRPALRLWWDGERRLWRSAFAVAGERPPELRAVFERTGYGCLAAETNIGVVHACHAADADVEAFASRPVLYQWQLITMPTVPLIRLEALVLDRPHDPFLFESFRNVAAEDQARVLAQLATQDRVYFAFYGDDMTHRFRAAVLHGEGQWQQLNEIVEGAERYWHSLPPEARDFDWAKADFMRRFF